MGRRPRAEELEEVETSYLGYPIVTRLRTVTIYDKGTRRELVVLTDPQPSAVRRFIRGYRKAA